MYNNFLFVIKIVFCFLLKIIKIRNGKMEFGKCKDWKTVRVRKHKDWKMYGLEDYRKVQK